MMDSMYILELDMFVNNNVRLQFFVSVMLYNFWNWYIIYLKHVSHKQRPVV